ncbi:polyprenyl synthetase family protein [uncultured Ligilactobacillus sp.]|uniref:polyprenyl synthetase family protein n=1 Tax=uncultured Ligilactobacillus sp. TaxID=2837633 RepID=UPI00272D5883|nr:polyprenyl synthetase family protein [uncultured Ligilactobacillus sp.]
MKLNFWQQYPLVKDDLQIVNQLIAKKIEVNDPKLKSALLQMVNNGGKYLRPALLLLFSKENSTTTADERLLKLAASIEVLHTATLIHDDIIDDSPKRRGQVSIQSAFGKDIAVYAGDLLFTVFFDLIADSLYASHYLKVNAQMMRQILNGEIGQMNARFDTEQSFLTYLRNINGKTAAIFSLACQEGAYFSGADRRQVALAKRIGQNIGLSFQMLDDILDYSDGKNLNKPVMEDLATGVYSLPLLMVLQEHKAELMPYLAKKEQMTATDMEVVKQLVLKYGGVTKAKALAEKFIQKALDQTSQLPASQKRDLLEKLIKRLLKKTN